MVTKLKHRFLYSWQYLKTKCRVNWGLLFWCWFFLLLEWFWGFFEGWCIFYRLFVFFLLAAILLCFVFNFLNSRLEEGIGHSIFFLLEASSCKFSYKPISNCQKMCLYSLLNLRSHRTIKIPSDHAVHILCFLRSANSVTLPLTLNVIHYPAWRSKLKFSSLLHNITK